MPSIALSLLDPLVGSVRSGLIYWWFPDTMFALDSPSIVIFPDYSPSEQKQQIYRTMWLGGLSA